MSANRPNPYLVRAADIERHAQSFSHPWNPRSQISGAMLGRMAGLKRIGVHFARIPPGKESFVYHSHFFEEEWIYILSGRGRARIDAVDYEVGAGDFMGFPTPAVAHHLVNDGSEDLVYLMGGESSKAEIAEFPDLGRIMVRRGEEILVFDTKDAKPLVPP
jgi:uncharacterized cupin superfamily protein